MKKDFKYSTIFSAQVFASSLENKKLQESTASYLKNKTNDLWEIEGSSFKDLYGVALEIALINQFNENGEGIDAKSCNNLAYAFKHKPLNIEHDRSSIVGHVIRGSFCERAFGKEIYPNEFQDSDEVFSLVLSGVVYKLANKKFSEIMKASINEESEIYSSWEIGFDEYKIAVGSSRKISECEILEDKASIEKYTPYLLTKGGTGKLPDGRFVQRLIQGEIVPLGGGFTLTPAAKVNPIMVYDPIRYLDQACIERSASEEKNKKSEKKISHSQKEDVTNNEKVINITKEGNKMDKEEIKKLIEEALASKQEMPKQESIAGVVDVIANAIRETNEQYKAEKESIAKEKEAAEASLAEQSKKVEELSESVKSFEQKLSEASSELESLKAEKAKIESQATFDARMDRIREIYEIDEKVSQIVAKRLSNVDSEEDFNGLLEEFSVTLAHLNKEAIASKIEESKKQEESKASKQDVDDAGKTIEGGGKENTDIPNTSQASSQEETLEEKFSKAFNKETVEIK
jgi:hypothetical protein